MNMAESLNPSQITLNFAGHFASIYDELTGSISEIRQEGTIKLPDGREVPNLMQVSVKDPDAIPITNSNGARRILHGIRLILNPHSAIGALSKDEIATICGNTIREMGVVMFANPIEYGVQSTSKLESEMLEIFDSVYIFLTSLKDAGFRGWVGGMYQVKVVGRDDVKRPEQGLLNNE